MLGGGATVLIGLAAYLVMRDRAQDPSADPSMVAAGASSIGNLEALLAAPAGSAGQQDDSDSTKTQVLTKTSLVDAIAFARPMMTNTVGRLDVGSAILAVWASKNLTWQSLEDLPETSPALFKKDPDAERGKRLCFSGTVVEIRAEKTLANRVIEDRALPLIERATSPASTSTSNSGSPYATAEPTPTSSSLPVGLGDLAPRGTEFVIPDGGKVFVATLQSKFDSDIKARLASKDSSFVEVVAVKSSGNLVDGSDARVCGVLTGVTVPPGGSTPTMMDATLHRIVGMFDLPQNRAAGTGEVASQHGG